MRNKFLTLFATTALVVALPATAIAGPVSAPTSQIQQSSTSSTSINEARDLFKAVYFGVGPSAEQFERSLDDAAYTNFRTMVEEVGPDMVAVDDVIDKVETLSPNVLTKWHVEMTSGDVLRVEAAFGNGAQKLESVVSAQAETQLEAATQADPEMANPRAAVPVFALWVAVVSAAGAVHAMAVAVQANVAWTQNAFWSMSSTGDGTLQSEKGIVALTETLHSF